MMNAYKARKEKLQKERDELFRGWTEIEECLNAHYHVDDVLAQYMPEDEDATFHNGQLFLKLYMKHVQMRKRMNEIDDELWQIHLEMTEKREA